jgi:nucleotide-binding universal stress UspA family protein
MDFSPAALQALGFAVDFARRVDASLTVLHVIEWLTEEEPRQLAPFDVESFRAHLLQDARARLEALLAEQPRVERGAHVRISGGRPYREILRVAAEDSTDLIVMGAQGRGGPALATLGSATQHVVRAASCPVLTVRAPLLDAR